MRIIIDFIKKKLNYKSLFIVIIAFSILVNLIIHLYLISSYGQIKPSPDAKLYLDIAYAIRHFSSTLSGVYNPVNAGQDIGYVLMPGYPLLISPLFENLQLIALFQIILFSLGLFCLFKVLYNKYLTFYAFFAPLWIIVSTSWSYHNVPLIESPTISILLILIYFLDRYFNDYQLKDFLWFSIIFGILIAVNNRYIFHYCGFIPFLLFLKIFEKRIKVKHLLLSILIVTLILAPWHIRQYIVYGKFVLFSPLRSVMYEQARKYDEETVRYRKIAEYEDYLKDSLNHPLKDDPQKLEEARNLFIDQHNIWQENNKRINEKIVKGETIPSIKKIFSYEPLQYKITDSLNYYKNEIDKIKLFEKRFGILNAQSPIVIIHQDTLAKREKIEDKESLKRDTIISYYDGKMEVKIQDLKVQSIKVTNFDNDSDFQKFEEIRVRKMVPQYDAIIQAIFVTHPNFANNPELLKRLLTDFSYVKYIQLVYEKFEPSNKFELIWNRFKEHFYFYRTDFGLTPQWDPRINLPSNYINPVRMILDLMMEPVVWINIIPLIIAIYKRNWLIISLAVFVFLHILLHSILNSGPGHMGRYRLTIYPVWITYAFYGYDQIARWIIKIFKEKKITRSYLALKFSLIKK